VLKRKLPFLASILLPLVIWSDSRIEEAHRLLAEADRFAMMYNWPEAVRLYARSESLFDDAGDRRHALAQVSGLLAGLIPDYQSPD